MLFHTVLRIHSNLAAGALTDLAITVDSETKLLSVWVDGLRMISVTVSNTEALTLLNTASMTAGTVKVDDLKIELVKNAAPVMVGFQSAGGATASIRFLATVDTLYYTAVGFDMKATGKTEKAYPIISIPDPETDSRSTGIPRIYCAMRLSVPRLYSSRIVKAGTSL